MRVLLPQTQRTKDGHMPLTHAIDTGANPAEGRGLFVRGLRNGNDRLYGTGFTEQILRKGIARGV